MLRTVSTMSEAYEFNDWLNFEACSNSEGNQVFTPGSTSSNNSFPDPKHALVPVEEVAPGYHRPFTISSSLNSVEERASAHGQDSFPGPTPSPTAISIPFEYQGDSVLFPSPYQSLQHSPSLSFTSHANTGNGKTEPSKAKLLTPFSPFSRAKRHCRCR